MLNESKKGVSMQELTIETIKKAKDLRKQHLNLINHCLNKGFYISVHLWSDTTPELDKSQNYEEIKKHAESSDMIDLCIYKKIDNEFHKIAWAMIVHGNNDDELISDYTAVKWLDEWAGKFKEFYEATA